MELAEHQNKVLMRDSFRVVWVYILHTSVIFMSSGRSVIIRQRHFKNNNLHLPLHFISVLCVLFNEFLWHIDFLVLSWFIFILSKTSLKHLLRPSYHPLALSLLSCIFPLRKKESIKRWADEGWRVGGCWKWG